MPAGGPAGHSRVAPRPQQCVPWQPKASRSTCAAGQQASFLARAELGWGVQGAAVAAVAAQYAGVLAVLGLLVRSTVLKLHDLVSSFPSWVDARPYVQVCMRSAAQRSKESSCAARKQAASNGRREGGAGGQPRLAGGQMGVRRCGASMCACECRKHAAGSKQRHRQHSQACPLDGTAYCCCWAAWHFSLLCTQHDQLVDAAMHADCRLAGACH